MPGDTLTPREVADELGVTVRTVQRWIRDGQLPATRVGGRMRVSRSSLSQVAPPAPAADQPRRRAISVLLVANRGEIVTRVARTASGLGIRVVGVHAAGERPPPGLHEARAIGSYLDPDAMVAAAQSLGADAIHPGYGFLSESPAFAAAVIDAGLTWVGPPRGAMAALGDKAASRRLSAATGVPVPPGYDGDAQDDATLLREARRIGLPLLVKPSAGGGGKGMRVVRTADELPDAVDAARREARRAFANERLILERLVEGARHVEVQVVLDAHGAAVHLGERDCSTQRRNQKVLEEAPAPSVTPALRARLGDAALAVARAAGYVNAGTAEFLLTDDEEFFFLEMNARLQVEHPVTEAVTGLDLVAVQLRVAAGEPLGFDQRDVSFDGHAVEARLYAEDPEAGFLPATGRVARLRWPTGVRVDTALAEGDEVTDRYDPLLAKLIAHGRDRADAMRRLRDALATTTVLGVRTNLRFLRWLLAQPVMAGGQMRTDSLDSMALSGPPELDEGQWRAAATTLAAVGDEAGPWAGGWRLNAPASVRLACGDEERTVEIDATGDDVETVVADGRAFVDVGGQSVEVRIAAPPNVEAAARHATLAGGQGSAILSAPMPGRVLAIRARPGDAVEAHAVVVVLEAMKMEHAVTTPVAGRVSAMAVVEGQQVQRGDLLAEVEPA